MKKITADLSKLDVLISKQYEDKIRGLAKDSLQNSWEAREYRKHGKNFTIVYEFFKKINNYQNVFMFEDFGTVGMDKSRWKAFHAHWVTTKGDYAGGIGRWGQGKTLYLFFSQKNIILTESIDLTDHKYRYSIRTNTGYWEKNDIPEPSDPSWVKKADGRLKLITDFFPGVYKLNHVGSRIWILDVKNELAEEIINGYLARQLSESWWELIRNYNINIIVRIHQNDKLQETIIKLPQLPDNKDKRIKERTVVDRGYGKIRKLKIALTKNPIPPSLQGVAIQRGRMTVCRYPFPSSITDELRERSYGYCMLDEQLDEKMWEIELANHEGFESRNAIWIKIRRKIDQIAEEFLSKYIKKEEVVTPAMNLDEIIQTVNKLVEEHITGLGKGGTGTTPGTNGRPMPPVHISPWGYTGSSKRFDVGDLLEIKSCVRNTTENQVSVNIRTWIEDSYNATYWSHDFTRLRVDSDEKKTLGFPDIELSNLGLSQGKHFLRAELKCRRLDICHKRTAVFYYEENPPQQLGGWLKKILLDALGGPRANLRNLPINKGVLVINKAYPEIAMLWRDNSLSKKQKSLKTTPILINIALHEAIREISLKWWEDENSDFDIGEIKKAKDLFDEMWAAYLIGSQG